MSFFGCCCPSPGNKKYELVETYNPTHSSITQHEYDRCGICEQPGVEKAWWSSYSVGAHSSCLGELKRIEFMMMKAVKVIFKDPNQQNRSASAGRDAVKQEIKGVALKTFLDCYGEDKLKSIYNSIGVAAVINYAATLKRRDDDSHVFVLGVNRLA